MQLTYGYDLKQNDDIMIPPRRTGEILSTFILPGAALVNHLPFRALPLSSTLVRLSHGSIQSNTPLPGFRYSSMNQWQVNVRNSDRG